ncbi:carbohydrate ABC transporter permease [Rhodopila sp.]|jgi:multiple sugar transport system permease protein|uniref:carbohydrate ABC transporter permease n=1 Tax=Rhodopila sp. TaxID=2480087 RepID=UPI002CCB1D9C|nr:sugar ABC transporter permease [Rhodopila sp.]HVZ09907.1 sugar ABC transporter permease [Rhodopila sp.]
MSTTQLAIGRAVAPSRVSRHAWRAGLQGSEFIWALAFILPYVAIFLAFVIYPIIYGLWLGSQPRLYRDLFNDPIYLSTVTNTLLYVGIGVNLKMLLAFLLSGFFMRKRWWVKALMMIYILPWAIPSLPAFTSIHWMLNGNWGFLNSLLYDVFGIDGPIWLNDRTLGMTSNIGAYIWKNMPFWTVIFLAGRMAIPQELYEAASVDGATGLRRFQHVTIPLIANLYLVSTLLSTIWSLGEFNAVFFVTGGGPAMSTEVLATLGIRHAFTMGEPRLGVAAVMSALPVLLPIVFILMRRLRRAEVQL